MDELTKLAIKYGTDKWGKHHYTPMYYEMLKDRRNEKGYVVELGIAEGASLKMWNDFFPNAGILGLDNDINRVKRFSDLTDIEVDEWPRISGDQCDQSSIESLQRIAETGLLKETFLFVDDGSHKPEDQINTCLILLPSLPESCVYVIEDVADLGILGPLSEKYATNTIECGKRYDDRLVIVKHK